LLDVADCFLFKINLNYQANAKVSIKNHVVKQLITPERRCKFNIAMHQSFCKVMTKIID